MGFMNRKAKGRAEKDAKSAEELSKEREKESTDSANKSSLDMALKKKQSKKNMVDIITFKKKSLSKIEGFEIPKEIKKSMSLVMRRPIFVVSMHQGNTVPETTQDVSVNKSQETTFTSESDRDEKITGKKGEKDRFMKIGAGGKKKSKISKIGEGGDDTRGKKKSKEKKKLQLKAKSESNDSDSSEIMGEEDDKENQFKKKKSASHKPTKPSATTKALVQLLKKNEKEKIRDDKLKQKTKNLKGKIQKMPDIVSLPKIKYSKTRAYVKDYETDGDDIVQCDTDLKSLKMIKGTEVFTYDPRYMDKKPEADVQPLLFRAQQVFSTALTIPKVPSALPLQEVSAIQPNKAWGILNSLDQTAELKGVLRYALSNREYIENGYTILPTLKVMRKTNIYKMIPANPKYDWFARHKAERILFYETGEKLAHIDEDGHGRWYYRNGILALDYYKAEEEHAGNRYVIYSSGQGDGFDTEPITVLGSFDHNGNGVVYDSCGNVRIKYNQTEGVVMDKRIGPLSRWQWHNLNEPPVLQPVVVEKYLEHTCLKKLIKGTNNAVEFEEDTRNDNEQMLNIELDNFFKEKAFKLLQGYKPFQIRMKALRINEQFSLKVIDQANIYLSFRDGQISFKLNLGMSLLSNEILDTDTTEASQILTPYDRTLPRSKSVAVIKRILEVNRKKRKC